MVRAPAMPRRRRVNWLNVALGTAVTAGIFIQGALALRAPPLETRSAISSTVTDGSARADAPQATAALTDLPSDLADSIRRSQAEAERLKDAERTRDAEIDVAAARGALAGLMAILPKAKPKPGPGGALTDERRKALAHKIHFQSHTPDRCLSEDLMGVIYDVAERFGTVKIVSTMRSPAHNSRVGGAPRSFHLQCRAIDFMVFGRTAGLEAYLRARPEVGGLKRYPLGFFHIDNGSARTW